eukprot:1675322-Prymnesium_polylepis.2
MCIRDRTTVRSYTRGPRTFQLPRGERMDENGKNIYDRSLESHRHRLSSTFNTSRKRVLEPGHRPHSAATALLARSPRHDRRRAVACIVQQHVVADARALLLEEHVRRRLAHQPAQFGQLGLQPPHKPRDRALGVADEGALFDLLHEARVVDLEREGGWREREGGGVWRERAGRRVQGVAACACSTDGRLLSLCACGSRVCGRMCVGSRVCVVALWAAVWHGAPAPRVGQVRLDIVRHDEGDAAARDGTEEARGGGRIALRVPTERARRWWAAYGRQLLSGEGGCVAGCWGVEEAV